MKRDTVEKYLKKKVRVKLFDGEEIEGYLRKTGEDDFKNDPNLYIPKNRYCLVDKDLKCVSCVIFRSSHIKSINVLQESEE